MNSDSTPPPDSEQSTPAQRVCPECGSAVAERSAFCDVCGARLDAEAGAAPPPAPRAATAKNTRTRDLLLAGLYVTVIAYLLYLVTKPEEGKGPPTGKVGMPAQGQGAAGALPPGHPSTGDSTGGPGGAPSGLPPAMVARMELYVDSLNRELQSNPGNDSARLKLANAYYDLERHAEAVRNYREYLRKKPNDEGARTDMAFSMASVNDIEGARDELMTVLTKNPRFQKAAAVMVMVYMARNDKDSTVLWLRKTADIDSTTQPGRNALDVLRSIEQAHAGGGAAPATP